MENYVKTFFIVPSCSESTAETVPRAVAAQCIQQVQQVLLRTQFLRRMKFYHLSFKTTQNQEWKRRWSHFCSQGDWFAEFVPPGQTIVDHQTVTGSLYADQLDRLLKSIRRVNRSTYQLREWFLLHGSGSVYSSLITFVLSFVSISNLLLENRLQRLIFHFSIFYCPGLAPADLFLFPKLKVALQGQRVWKM